MADELLGIAMIFIVLGIFALSLAGSLKAKRPEEVNWPKAVLFARGCFIATAARSSACDEHGRRPVSVLDALTRSLTTCAGQRQPI